MPGPSFNRLAAVYDRLAQLIDGPLLGYLAVRLPLRPVPGTRAIDLGCGTGLHTIRLAARYEQVVGVDTSAQMIGLARRTRPHPRVDYRQADLRDLHPDRDGRYDLVLSAYALHHLPPEEHPDALVALAGLVRPGGQLIIIDIAGPPRSRGYLIAQAYRVLAGDLACRRRPVRQAAQLFRIAHHRGLLAHFAADQPLHPDLFRARYTMAFPGAQITPLNPESPPIGHPALAVHWHNKPSPSPRSNGGRGCLSDRPARRVLVTGAAGFIGSHLVDALLARPSFSDLPIPRLLRHRLSAHQPANPARFLAERLAEGRIVGLFRGRLEAGPRALGNRSILASPLRGEVVDRLNATVKFREPFRPLAPVVPTENAARYFTLGQPSPFMSIASGVTDLARTQIPAVVHVNGTARVQTVTAEHNPFLAEVLVAFAKVTGVPVLINTSLNIRGQPICGTPEMAINCLTTSGLDALMIDDWWVTKNGVEQ